MLTESMLVKILYAVSGAIFILSGIYCNYKQGEDWESSMQIAFGITCLGIGAIQE
jgi:hypothetical protein